MNWLFAMTMMWTQIKVWYEDLIVGILYWKVKRFFIRSKRALKYAVVGWNTENWDSAYTLRLMRTHLEELRSEIDKKSMHVGKERSVRQIRTVELLIERILDEFANEDPELQEINDKLGNIKFVPVEEHPEYSRLIRENEDKLPPDEVNRLHKRMLYIHQRQHKQQELAWELLCKIIRKHMRGWWW